MIRRSLRVAFVAMLFGVSAFAGVSSAYPRAMAPAPTILAVEGEGFLTQDPVSGLKIAHIKGTPSEMGYQYGVFLGKDIIGIGKEINRVADEMIGIPGAGAEAIKQIGGALFLPYFKSDELDLLRGVLRGLDRVSPGHDVTLEKLVFFNSLVDAGALFGAVEINCDTFCAWGPVTEEGKMFQTRNIDLFIGYGLEHYPSIEVAKPAGGVPLANPGWAGMLGMVSGMNANGLAMGQVYAKSNANQLGRPWPMIVREYMSRTDGNAETLADAMINEPNRTYGCNFVFGDPDTGYGVAVEFNSKFARKYYSMDPAELELRYNGEICAIQVPNVVFRGDQSFDPRIRRDQVSSNGPDGDMRTAGAYRNRYKGQSDRILAYMEKGVKIGSDEAIAISRETAMPDSSLQCVAYANSDLQMFVAYSVFDEEGNVHGAYSQPYNHFNFDAVAPEINLRPAKQVLSPGSMLTVPLETKNWGNEKSMDLYVILEIGGMFLYVTQPNMNFMVPPMTTDATPIRLNMDADQFRRDMLMNFRLPSNMPAMDFKVYAVLLSAETGALADLSIREFSVVTQ